MPRFSLVCGFFVAGLTLMALSLPAWLAYKQRKNILIFPGYFFVRTWLLSLAWNTISRIHLKTLAYENILHQNTIHYLSFNSVSYLFGHTPYDVEASHTHTQTHTHTHTHYTYIYSHRGRKLFDYTFPLTLVNEFSSLSTSHSLCIFYS